MIKAQRAKAPQFQERMVRGERKPENDHSQSDARMAADGDGHADEDDAECDKLNRTNDHWHEPDNIMVIMTVTTMPIAMLMITTTKMTTMMRRKPVSTAMVLCANRAGT